MELMSSVLFCAFVAMLPQALGKSRVICEKGNDTTNSTCIMKPSYMLKKELLLNVNAPPLVENHSQLRTVLRYNTCTKCTLCIKNAINEYKVELENNNNQPTSREMQEDLLKICKTPFLKPRYRRRRDKETKFESKHSALHSSQNDDNLSMEDEMANDSEGTTIYSYRKLQKKSKNFTRQLSPKVDELIHKNHLNDSTNDANIRKRGKRQATENSDVSLINKKSTPKVKTKNIKVPRSFSVTKYLLNGKEYALKILEVLSPNSTSSNKKDRICQVYKIGSSFECGSFEADLILKLSTGRSKKNKKKVTTKKMKLYSEDKDKLTTKPMYNHKREVSSHISKETFMPSIEDLY